MAVSSASHAQNGAAKKSPGARRKSNEPWWIPLSLSDATPQLSASSLVQPKEVRRPTNGFSQLRGATPGGPNARSMARGHSFGVPGRMALSVASDSHSEPSNDDFFRILAEARARKKVFHSDPFDKLGPELLFGKEANRERKGWEGSLYTGDALRGFKKGGRAAFKSTGELMTVLRPAASAGMLEVQLDPEDVDAEGEILSVPVEDMLNPSREELMALELRKHKMEVTDSSAQAAKTSTAAPKSGEGTEVAPASQPVKRRFKTSGLRAPPRRFPESGDISEEAARLLLPEGPCHIRKDVENMRWMGTWHQRGSFSRSWLRMPEPQCAKEVLAWLWDQARIEQGDVCPIEGIMD